MAHTKAFSDQQSYGPSPALPASNKRHTIPPPPPLLIDIEQRVGEEWLRITATNQKPCIWVEPYPPPVIDRPISAHMQQYADTSSSITDGSRNNSASQNTNASASLHQQLHLFPTNVRQALASAGIAQIDYRNHALRQTPAAGERASRSRSPKTTTKTVTDTFSAADNHNSNVGKNNKPASLDADSTDPLESFYMQLATRQIDFDTQVRHASIRLELPKNHKQLGTSTSGEQQLAASLWHCCLQHVMLGMRCLGQETGKGHCCYQRLNFEHCCRGRHGEDDAGHGWPPQPKTGSLLTSFPKRLPCAECFDRVFRFPRITKTRNMAALFHDYRKHKRLLRAHARMKATTLAAGDCAPPAKASENDEIVDEESDAEDGGDHMPTVAVRRAKTDAMPGTEKTKNKLVDRKVAEQLAVANAVPRIFQYRRSARSGHLVRGRQDTTSDNARRVVMRRFMRRQQRQAFARYFESKQKCGGDGSGNRHSITVDPRTRDIEAEVLKGITTLRDVVGPMLPRRRGIGGVAVHANKDAVRREVRDFLKYIVSKTARNQSQQQPQSKWLKRLSTQQPHTSDGETSDYRTQTAVSGPKPHAPDESAAPQANHYQVENAAARAHRRSASPVVDSGRFSSLHHEPLPVGTLTKKHVQPQQQVNNVTSLEQFDALLQEFGATTNFVFVEFYATWCPSSRLIARNIQRCLAPHRDNVDCIRVDIDRVPELVERFDIRAIPLFIIFQAGQVLRQGLMSTYKEIQKALQLVENAGKRGTGEPHDQALPEFLWRRQFLLDCDSIMASAQQQQQQQTMEAGAAARQSHAHLAKMHGAYLPNPYLYATKPTLQQQQSTTADKKPPSSSSAVATASRGAGGMTTSLRMAPSTKQQQPATIAAIPPDQQVSSSQAVDDESNAVAAIRRRKRYGHHYGHKQNSRQEEI